MHAPTLVTELVATTPVLCRGGIYPARVFRVRGCCIEEMIAAVQLAGGMYAAPTVSTVAPPVILRNDMTRAPSLC